MRIALITPGGVDRGGVERVIPCFLWLIERLARAGDDVQIFALYQEPEPGHWPLLGAQVHNAGGGTRKAALRSLGQLVAGHRRAPFDVVHAMWPAPAGVLAAIAGTLLRVPILLHLVGGDLVDLSDIGYGGRATARGRFWLKLAVAGADRIVAPSGFVVDQARSLGITAQRIPFGVAPDRWPPAAPRRRLPGAPLRLLQVASLNPVKDQGMLLAVADALHSHGLDFSLEIIGEDTLGGAIQARAAQLGLEDRIRFHGFLPSTSVRQALDQTDLLLITSRHEAGPIVALEAAVAGVPTIGTRVGHLADWADEAAWVVAPGDVSGMATAIMRLDGDEEIRLALAVNAQARALAEDADDTCTRIRAVYRELAGES